MTLSSHDKLELFWSTIWKLLLDHCEKKQVLSTFLNVSSLFMLIKNLDNRDYFLQEMIYINAKSWAWIFPFFSWKRRVYTLHSLSLVGRRSIWWRHFIRDFKAHFWFLQIARSSNIAKKNFPFSIINHFANIWNMTLLRHHWFIGGLTAKVYIKLQQI